ncbi:hypothetical protein LTR97_011040 [Elasticomyces elasticus]|uniref:Uncharacterized protein n=1 Tax=Elasticomyces elasticus TaxID=574655 RepID=A0AAN7ZVZ4_9PEZI|nr:hypothetical protein LTR97_011040 [Elasticomyces elasticus]
MSKSTYLNLSSTHTNTAASTKKSIIFTASTPPQAPKKTFRDFDRVEHYEMDSGRIINAANNLDIRTPARCQFLELPTELRLLIYDLVYDTDYKPAIYIYGDRSKRGRLTHRGPPSIARPCLSGVPYTCRAIYKEALPVLYRTQSFHVQFLRSWSTDTSFPMTVLCSYAFAKHIKHLNITVIAYKSQELTSAVERLESFLAALGGTISGEIRLRLGENPYSFSALADPVYKVLITAQIGENATLFHELHTVMPDVRGQMRQNHRPSSARKRIWREFKKGFKGRSAMMPPDKKSS